MGVQRLEAGTVRDLGMDMCTQLCLKWRANEDPPWNIGTPLGSRGSLDVRGVWGRQTRVRMAESLHHPPERSQHGSSAVLQYKIKKSFKKERGREDRVAQCENKNRKSLEFW